MIPKLIHYIWLSDDPYPEEIKDCMASWSLLEGYEFKKWDRNNFDIEAHPFVKKMYDARLYAFASDYIRLWALYNYGGIYLDTDVEILKPLDPLLSGPTLLGHMGIWVAAYIMGCEKGNELFEILLKYYDLNINEPMSAMEYTITPIIGKYREIIDKDLKIYPTSYFSSREKDKAIYILHHFKGMWKDKYMNYTK